MKKKFMLATMSAILMSTSIMCHLNAYADDSVEVYNGSDASTSNDDDSDGEVFAEEEREPSQSYIVPEDKTLTKNETCIDTNNGTVTNNAGTITDNFGTIGHNTGTVENNYVSQDGGIIELSDSFANNTFYNIIINGNGSIVTDYSSQIVEKNDKLWVGNSPNGYYITVQTDSKNTLDTSKYNEGEFVLNDDNTWSFGDIDNPITIYFKLIKTNSSNSNSSNSNNNSNNSAPAEPSNVKFLSRAEYAPEPLIKEASNMEAKTKVPSHSILATNMLVQNSLFDIKVDATNASSTSSQKYLAQKLINPNVNILLTLNIYPRRNLSLTENGSLTYITWDNLPKNDPGPVYAIAYNQIDGAYVLEGTVDANGAATFSGFKLRPASTITICK